MTVEDEAELAKAGWEKVVNGDDTYWKDPKYDTSHPVRRAYIRPTRSDSGWRVDAAGGQSGMGPITTTKKLSSAIAKGNEYNARSAF